jgi:hypothetical protein
MNITLLTAYSDEYWPLCQINATNKLDYCLKYKLQFSLKHHKTPVFDSNNNQWSWGEREIFMRDSLKECDWLWFMGGDTLIMNYNIDVHSLIDDNYDFIIAKDYNGINNDVFLLKHSIKSFEFLDEVFKRHILSPTNDQSEMEKLKDNISGFTYKIISQKLFNCYLYDTEPEYNGYPKGLEGNYSDGDFILHLPGMTLNRRIEIINKYLLKVIK